MRPGVQGLILVRGDQVSGANRRYSYGALSDSVLRVDGGIWTSTASKAAFLRRRAALACPSCRLPTSLLLVGLSRVPQSSCQKETASLQ